MVAVVFVSNLVKRHPNCRVLLHRANADGITCGSRDFTFVAMHAQKVAYAHVLDQLVFTASVERTVDPWARH